MRRSKETKAERTRRLKRRNNLIKKVNEFHSDFGFKAYLMIQGGNHRYIYTTETGTSWPPALSDMVRAHALLFSHRLPNISSKVTHYQPSTPQKDWIRAEGYDRARSELKNSDKLHYASCNIHLRKLPTTSVML